MTQRCALARVVAGMLLLAGCVAERGPRRSSPSLVLLDTVVLDENDSVFVAQAEGLAALSDGSVLVADRRSGVIHQYARDGRHVGRIGRRGAGPGEFPSGPGELVVDGDSLLLVHIADRVKLLELPSGVERWTRRIPGAAIPSSIPLAARDGRFFFRLIHRGGRTSVALVSDAADRPAQGGPFPEWLGRSHGIDQSFSYLEVAPLGGDSIAVVFELSDYVFVGPFHGPFDSVLVPVLHRHGSRPDLLATIRDDEPQGAASVVYALSIPSALRRLSSGNLAYVTADLEQLSRRFGVTLYLSVVNPREGLACPDARIPGPNDPRPLATFLGDTLITLTQHLTGNTEFRTVVRRYLIDTNECRWLNAS